MNKGVPLDVRRFVLRLKVQKKLGDAVQNCAVFLRDILKRKGELVQGYAHTETGEKLQYYWVEDSSGGLYDICFEIAKMNQPSISDFKFTLHKETPPTFDKDDHNQELFKLYQDEPSKFWKLVPRLTATN
jgi:hypothetical protein